MTIVGIPGKKRRDARGWVPPTLLAAIVFALPMICLSQTGIVISDFEVSDWFRSVRVTWKANAPAGADGVFEIYRSDQEAGPYILVQDIRLGNKKFIDVIKKAYVFYDKQLKVGGRYYYKLVLRGSDDVFGPAQGLASGAPPGT
jgi:hypothetical protein